MTDTPQPSTATARTLSLIADLRDYYQLHPGTAEKLDEIAAAVAQLDAELAAATAPSVEIVQGLLESENEVDRLRAQVDVLAAALARARAAYLAGDWDALEPELGIAQPPDAPTKSVADLLSEAPDAKDDDECPDYPCPNDPDGQHHAGCGCWF